MLGSGYVVFPGLEVYTTVGVAYRVPGKGAVLVSDGRVTCDGEIVSDHERKYVLCGATACLVAGDIGPAWRSLQEKAPANFKAFRKALESTDDSTDWLAYDRYSDKLWSGHVRLIHPFATLGTGASIALGALEAHPHAKDIETAEKLAVMAVRAAIRWNTTCGGRIRVLVAPRRGEPIVRP